MRRRVAAAREKFLVASITSKIGVQCCDGTRSPSYARAELAYDEFLRKIGRRPSSVADADCIRACMLALSGEDP